MSVVINAGSARIYKNEATLAAAGDLILAVSGNTITINNLADLTDLEDTILAAVLQEYNTTGYILKVGGAKPLSDGTLFILGSECDNIAPPPNAATTNNKLVITDVCPACKTCDTVAALRQNSENLELFYNAVKDAQIYTSGVTETRFSALYADKLYLSTTGLASTFCSTLPGNSSYSELYTELMLPAFDLLKKYAVLMHMWNYAVRNLTTTNSVTSSDSNIQVASSHAFTYCEQGDGADKMCVRCQITFEPDSAGVQSGLSVYVPDAVISGAAPVSGGVSSKNTTISTSAYTKKVVSVTFYIDRAGAYTVQQNFVPFIWGSTTCSSAATSRAGSVKSVSGGTSCTAETPECVEAEVEVENEEGSAHSTEGTYESECTASPATLAAGTHTSAITIRDTSEIYLNWQDDDTGETTIRIEDIDLADCVSIGKKGSETTTFSIGRISMPQFTSSTKQIESPTLTDIEEGSSYMPVTEVGFNSWRVTIAWYVGESDQTPIDTETYFIKSKKRPSVAS